MSIDLLERGAAALGDLVDEVVFVGGATVALWITDPAAPPPRPTKDVDVIVEVVTRSGYYAFEDRLRAAGFRNDEEVICRWHHPTQEVMLDAMPTDSALLGFENEWQRRAFPHAIVVELPSGARIRAVPPPFLLATKLEAYLGRGKGDLLASRILPPSLPMFLPTTSAVNAVRIARPSVIMLRDGRFPKLDGWDARVSRDGGFRPPFLTG